MRISEIFYSIQGEGTLAGVPSVFVRTSGCNLRCTWCDTPYTSWKPEGYQMTHDALLTEIRQHSCAHVVITGGEPMILADLPELTKKIKDFDQHITIETAGTTYQKVRCDLMSISPKLANSTPYDREDGKFAAQHEQLRYQPEVLKQLIAEYDYQLKFVISSVDDVREAREMVREIGAQREKVLLMPEGTSREVLSERAEWLVNVCKDFGYRYCPRLHIDIWGAKRGV
jgi:7-carboxy-7-deazaguanine synthase